MKLAKLTVTIVALFFLSFGLLLFFAPAMLSMSEIQLTNPTALMEVRAFYGGAEIGLAVFLLVFLRRGRVKEALELSVCILTGILCGRAYGAAVDGIEGLYILAALSMEAPLFLLSLYCLRSWPRDSY